MEEFIFDKSEIVRSSTYFHQNCTKQQAVNNAINIFNCGLDIDTCKKYIVDILGNFSTIEFTKNNILTYVNLAEHYCSTNDFLNYVIDEYIINKNCFYDILCKMENINQIIIENIENNNNIKNMTYSYLYEHNTVVFDNVKKLESLHINENNLLKFKCLTELNISDNNKITDNGIKYLKLRFLNVSGNCNITNDGIKNMELEVLNSSTNNKITDDGIKHMKLHTLIISNDNNSSDFCGISDAGIVNMKLKCLIATKNRKITNDGIRNMSLDVLIAPRSRITKKGTEHMNPRVLIVQ